MRCHRCKFEGDLISEVVFWGKTYLTCPVCQERMREELRRSRMKRLYVSHYLLNEILHGKQKLLTLQPDDAIIEGTHPDYCKRGIHVFIWSSEFDPVPPGEMLPEIKYRPAPDFETAVIP